MPSLQPKPLTADGQPAPSKLKLAFSRAADGPRISKILDPAVKSKIDPNAFVIKRSKTAFNNAVANGRAAFLHDAATGEVRTLSMAYHTHDEKGQHKYTENGTSITSLAGYGSAPLVISALVLSQWWKSPPSGMIVAEILAHNKPSRSVYEGKLGWQPITDKAKADDVQKLTDMTLPPSERGQVAPWYSCPDSALPKLARVLLDYMDRGTLVNKHTGHSIDLDLSALEGTGLTRARLEMIARGIVSKTLLSTPPPGGPRP